MSHTTDADKNLVMRELQELIAALDRRVPHVERVGEAAIAKAATALRSEALRRIEELEREDEGNPDRTRDRSD